MKLRFALAAACAALLLAPAVQARHVDFYDAGNFDVTALAGGSNTDTQLGLPTGDSGVLGGERRVTVSATGVGQANATLNVVGGGNNDDAVLLTADVAAMANYRFETGFDGNNLDADFLNIPGMPGRRWDSIEVVFGPNDSPLGLNGLLVTLVSGNGTLSEETAMASIAGGTLTGGSLFLPYSDFLADNPALDLTDIDRAELAIDGGLGATYNLGFFARAGNVPEPTSLALFGLGLVGLAGRRRR